MGGAPRGECASASLPKGQRVAPRPGLPPQRQNHPTCEHTALPMWEARPAAMQAASLPKRPKLRPRSGLPPQRQNPTPHVNTPPYPCGRRAPAANAPLQACPKGQSFAPRSGLPQQRQNHPTPEHTALLHVGGAPRGECRPQACPKGQSFAPRPGLPPQQQNPTPHVNTPPFPMWEARPRGECRLQACQHDKAPHEVGPPTTVLSLLGTHPAGKKNLTPQTNCTHRFT